MVFYKYAIIIIVFSLFPGQFWVGQWVIDLHLVRSFHHSSLKTLSLFFVLLSMSSFIWSSYHLLGLPLGLLPSPFSSIADLGILVSSNLLTCPNHLSLFCSICSLSSSIPVLFLISSFLILSLLVLPSMLLRNFISAACILFASFSVIVHVSDAYVRIGTQSSLYIISLHFFGLLGSILVLL